MLSKTNVIQFCKMKKFAGDSILFEIAKGVRTEPIAISLNQTFDFRDLLMIDIKKASSE